MSKKCDDCGQIPPQNSHEETMNHLRLVEDEMILGHSLECGTCGTRLNPVDPEDEKDNGEVKFLEGENIVHGLE